MPALICMYSLALLWTFPASCSCYCVYVSPLYRALVIKKRKFDLVGSWSDHSHYLQLLLWVSWVCLLSIKREGCHLIWQPRKKHRVQPNNIFADDNHISENNRISEDTPLSEDTSNLRGQPQYQRTTPISEDKPNIRGQPQYQRTNPIQKNEVIL